jgi:peptidoglycan/xylan/chitin deacetylase (PgdA/CDA1 family)
MTNPRVPFEMSSNRKSLAPPNGKPLMVHVVVNVEAWPFDQPMPRKYLTAPHGKESFPDVPNWAWAEYGLRMGMPRLFKMFRDKNIPVSAFLNASVIDLYPTVAAEIKEAGWEIVGHGLTQKSIDSHEDERATIIECLDKIEKYYGTRPRGWLGPGLKESLDTPDYLKEVGIDYLCDWVLDDGPCWMTTKHGPMICMPYTVEINDSPAFAIQAHSSDEMYKRFQDTVEVFGEEAKTQPRVLTIALHPHLIGVPHRIGYLAKMIDDLQARDDTIFMTGATIADWFVEADKNAS